MQTLVVNQMNLAQATLVEEASKLLSAGQIKMAVQLFALTANNMTYAAFGKAMRYWDFYPRNDGGVVPVWGFAQVVETAHETITVGQRFYGYYPIANQVIFEPSHASERGFQVANGTRADLAAVYNQYVNVASDPFYAACKVNGDATQSEAIQALLRPLYVTSWLLADFFRDNQFFGADTVLCTSASSKTAYLMAAVLKKGETKKRVVGLTSAGNVAFCESLGCYDQVLTYNQFNKLGPSEKLVLIDFAGNSDIRRQIHSHYANLLYSCAVGGTHHHALGGSAGLIGPKPILFFAPAQMKKRQADWGGAKFGEILVSDWALLLKQVTHEAAPWVKVSHQTGALAISEAWQKLAGGAGNQTPPQFGTVFSFS